MVKTYVRFEVPEEVKGKKIEQEYLTTAQQVLKEQTVLRLYKEEKISTGTGARLLGIPLYDFIRFLGEHQVSIFNYSPEELEADVEAATVAKKSRAPKGRKRRP